MLLKSLMLSSAILLSAPALAQQATTPPTATAATAAVSDPATFVAMAGVGNTFEIESSTLAKETTQNEEVKAFADQMVVDHTKAAQDLATAAAAQDITPPDELDEKHQAMMDQLQDAEGDAFDTAYIAAQQQAHDEAVSLFEGYAASGPDGALKDFAAATLPTLKMHQEHIHGMAGQ